MQPTELTRNVKDPKWDNIVMGTLPDSYVASSNDLFWAVDAQRKLIFANEAYLDFIYQTTGTEVHVDDHSPSPDGNKAMTDKWDYFYNRTLQGEQFHIITNFAAQKTGMLVNANFVPLISDDHIMGAACLARATSSMIPASMLTPNEEENTSFYSQS
ncbi:MAG: domain S-box-containing protein [Bacteroidetes bacterium]|nr:domain S-box-containing protein [Bacteroidota bacterium]